MNRQLQHREINNKQATRKLILICDGVQSPANMGAIFRLCDAFGVHKVYFSGAVDTGSGRLRKTSRSTYSWINYQDLANPLEVVTNYKQQGYRILALEIADGSTSIQDINADGPLCLLVGGESHGISQEVLALCEQAVHIDLYGENSSMNVAQATAILLYQLSKS